MMLHEPSGSCPPLKPSLGSAARHTGAVKPSDDFSPPVPACPPAPRCLPTPRRHRGPSPSAAEAHKSSGVLGRCLNSVSILGGPPTSLVASS
jgi:hypothetical protein